MSMMIPGPHALTLTLPASVLPPQDFAEALARIEAMPSVTKQEKAVARCDFKKFAHAVGRPLESIPCDPAVLAALIEEARPAADNMKPHRWRNVKSGTLRALRLVGVDIASGRGDKNEEWRGCDALLPTLRLRYRLSRLLGYFSEHDISAETVNQGHFDRFAHALQHEYVVKNHATRYSMTCVAWNEAVLTVPGWPQVLVEMPDRRKRSSIPKLSDLRMPLQDDIAAYGAFRAKPYLADDDQDDDDGEDYEEIDPLRASSLQKAEYNFRRAVGYLVDTGVQVTDLTSIADLVTVPMFKRLRDHLLDLHDQEGNSQAWGILCTLTGAARHWVYEDQDDKRLKKLCKFAGKLKPAYDGITEKNLVRLKAAIDSVNFKRLLHLSGDLAALARNQRTPMMAAVHAMQMAVAIRILLVVAPVRVYTLSLTKLGTHLHGSRPGLQGDVLLCYSKQEIKNKVGQQFNVDRATADLITEYMTVYRPRLDYGDPDALFPGQSGSTKGAGTLANQISNVIREHTGLDFNVHLFRHFAGYVYLRNHPNDYETLRRLLGHKDIATTMNSYVWIDTETAILRYQTNIIVLMETL